MARSARCGSTNTARLFSTFIFAKWRAWTESSPTPSSRPTHRSASSGHSIQNNLSNNRCSRATTRRANFSNSADVRGDAAFGPKQTELLHRPCLLSGVKRTSNFSEWTAGLHEAPVIKKANNTVRRFTDYCLEGRDDK